MQIYVQLNIQCLLKYDLWNVHVLGKDLAFQKTSDTSESILEMGPILFSSDEFTEWPTVHCHLNAFKKRF